MHRQQHRILTGGIGAAAAALLVVASAGSAAAGPNVTHAAVTQAAASRPAPIATTTPIKHLVVIFDENVSFDHCFATYPKAANTDGTKFTALPYIPKANTLANANLIKKNPNTYKPQRLASTQAVTCDQNHNYLPEQKAENGGLMDQFEQNVSKDTCTGMYGAPGLAMDYYDGNTVTALWNYAQLYSMSDNSFGSGYGPSTPGALELVSGQTHGATALTSVAHTPTTDSYAVVAPNAKGVGTVINDPDPAYDDCSDTNHTSTNNLASMSGKNIGDLLNAKKITWGWFQGGFAPTIPYAGPGTYAVCGATHPNLAGASSADYSPHHSPFEYYASTSNPHHLPPSSVAAIGHTDQANHNYDLTNFSQAVKANNLPAVSFLKAAEYQDGHAGYSDPIDEQHFLVSTINQLQKSKEWNSTAVVIAYDDSDGWYDHVYAPPKNGSSDAANNSTACTYAAGTVGVKGGYQDRCGPGPRLPLLVISPYSKTDYVDHTKTEQASITKFIEDNWHTGRVGDASFDTGAGSLNGLFDFDRPIGTRLILNNNGAIKSIGLVCAQPLPC